MFIRRPQRRRGRAHRNRPSVHSEASVDSIQQVVIERLRNAPPNYMRAMLLTPDDTPPPYNAIASARTNPGFVSVHFVFIFCLFYIKFISSLLFFRILTIILHHPRTVQQLNWRVPQ